MTLVFPFDLLMLCAFLYDTIFRLQSSAPDISDSSAGWAIFERVGVMITAEPPAHGR
jgi:hypothetical protein